MRLRPGPGVAAALALVSSAALAQELEPRAYAPNPTGVNFALVSYGHSTGDVVFDPSVPITNTHAEVNTTSVFYGRTFGLLGRFASIGAAMPYVWGTVSGDVFEQHKSAYRSGLGDLRLRFVANLKGGPALSPSEFAQRRPQTTLGASVVVVAPTGQYDPSKLINVGTHRWSVKPEFGISHPTGRWFLELYAGVWLFTDNNDFFGGSVRSQDPLYGLQSHAIFSVRRRLWLAADATFYTGGRTTVDGLQKADLQRNSRFGLTASIPVKQRGSVKLSWARGLIVRVGGDFTTLSAGYQVSWF